MLTQEQGDAVLEQLRQALTAAQQRAEENRASGEHGIIAGVLEFFGADHISQLDAQVGAVNIIGGAVVRLQSDLPIAIADPATGDRWTDAARYAAHELATLQSDISEATIEDTLAKTAAATGTQVKEGVNIVAGNTARLVWSAIPWWVLVGGGLVVAGYGYLQVRRVA